MLSAIKCTKFIDANLVCDIVPSVGQEAGQGELVHTGRVPSVLHLNTILGHTSQSPVLVVARLVSGTWSGHSPLIMQHTQQGGQRTSAVLQSSLDITCEM